MGKLEDLIDELETLGVNLELKDDEINFAPKSKVTPEMLSRMKDRRDELISYLQFKEAQTQALIKYGSFTRGPFIFMFFMLLIASGFFNGFLTGATEESTTFIRQGATATSTIVPAIFSCVLFILVLFRIRNMGYSLWWSILYFIPLVNFFVLIACMSRSQGYADRKRAK